MKLQRITNPELCNRWE